MEFEVKVNDIYKFLKNNGYLWQSKQATLPIYDYEIDVTDENLYDDFEDDEKLQLFEMPVKRYDGKYLQIDVCINNIEFVLEEENFGSAKSEIDLSKDWVKFLLKNYKEYSIYLENWYNDEKTSVCNFYDEKIKILSNNLKNCKKQYVDELKQLNEYKKILSDFKKEQLKEEIKEL